MALEDTAARQFFFFLYYTISNKKMADARTCETVASLPFGTWNDVGRGVADRRENFRNILLLKFWFDGDSYELFDLGTQKFARGRS